MRRLRRVFSALICTLIVVLFAALSGVVLAQGDATNADHQAMLAALHITSPLRPGPAGRLNPDGTAPPNFANYDESKATAKSSVPPLLVMADGRPITTPAMWNERRKELLEIFDREIYGRVPDAAKTIAVRWEVTGTTEDVSGAIPTTTRTLVGHVDPTYDPAITVDILASVTTPTNAAGKVPVIIQWGGGQPGGGRGRPGVQSAASPRRAPASWQQTALSRGWGYGSLSATSIQPDAGGDNLVRGIIGLINKGARRKPDDWGALRAWAWGASL
jgi:hypothetical protein